MSPPIGPARALRHLGGIVVALVLTVVVTGCSEPSIDHRDTFAPISALPPVQALALGGRTPVALTRDGAVYAWGGNFYGQAGEGRDDGCGTSMVPRPCRRTPEVIPLPGPATAVAGSDDHHLATTRDGTVWTWGADHAPDPAPGADLVCATLRCRTVPVAVAGLPPVTAISAGPGTDAALDATGQVWIWGATIDGPDRCLRDVARSPGFACSVRPRPVPGLPPVVAVSAAAQGRITVLGNDGTLWWWGTGYPGPYPTGTSASAAPQRVDIPVPVSGVVAAGETTVAVGADGSVWTWGRLQARDRSRCTAPDGCVTTPAPTLPPGSAAGVVPGGALRVRSTSGSELTYTPLLTPGYAPPPPGDQPVPAPPSEGGWLREASTPRTVAFVGEVATAGHGSVALRLSTDGQVEARGDNTYGQLAV